MSQYKSLTNKLQAIIMLNFCLLFSLPAYSISLMNAIELGLQNNLAINASRKSVEENQYNIAVSRSNFLPALNASADTKWNENTTDHRLSKDATYSYNSHSYSLSMSWSLFDIKNIYDYQRSKLNYDIEKLNHENQIQKIIYEIASNYFKYLKNNAQLRATQAELKSARIREKQITRNIELGNTAVNEIYEAIGQKESIENRLLTLKKEDRIILNELKNQIQQPIFPSQDIIENFPFRQFSKEQEKNILAQLPFNYDVIIAQNKVKSSQLSSKSSKASFYPNVSLSASYRDDDANNFDASDLDATGKSTGTVVSVNLNLPLFSGGSDYYGVKKAIVAIERENLLYQEILTNTENQLTTSILSVNSLANSITRLENIMLANRASYLGIEKAYELGTRTITDLLASESKLFNAVRDYQNARYDYLIELFNLEQLKGTLNLNTMQNTLQIMQELPAQMLTNTLKIKDIVPAYLLERKIAPSFPLKEID